MQACAEGHALTYSNTPKLHLASWKFLGLTAAKFEPVMLPMHGLSLSNTKYIWIYMLSDYLCLCSA
jgi:hypothetical protein